jgi:hypothetical protein
MAISYQKPIWPHWLWNTGLRCAPQTVILRGFAVCLGLTRFPHSETGKKPRFPSLNRALPDKNTFIGWQRQRDAQVHSYAGSIYQRRALYRFAHTMVTRKVVERGLLPQRAPFSRGTRGYALNVPLQ